ncbi:MAG TPA: FAD-dependent oxidoreductase [Bryobacteraceae bacterium]|nr:FAD-dependent oxidoreductase [Bryobacteraceae bacterium]
MFPHLLAAFLSTYTFVDIEAVRATGDPKSFVRTAQIPTQIPTHACDVLIAGAGMGGVGAALRAAARGHQVCLTEEATWIGGQATAAGVSALDENKFIELTGGTRLYNDFRRRIREHYKHTYHPHHPAENFNPGGCYVSSLCFEPKVGVHALEEMIRPHRNILLFRRTRVLDLERQGNRITAALLWNIDRKQAVKVVPKFVLDATEMGDLLPLAKTPYTVGSEPKAATAEPHAAEAANPACVQSFTYPFIIENRPGESHTIAKPEDFEKIRDHQPFGMVMNYPAEYGWRGRFEYTMFGDDPPVPNNMSPRPFFSWRRVFNSGAYPGKHTDQALMNWPRQDYHDESVLDRTPEDTARVLQNAKKVSMAFLYWLQNDQKTPSLKLRTDQMGTADGLSQLPYIRESRRLQAQGMVREQDIVFENSPRARAVPFADSVGTGFYMVDIHPCGPNEKGRMMMPKPFQVPLAAMLPKDLENFLPASKNLGVTHLTNGAYRLHPIEWNVGEAAAVVASLRLKNGTAPTEMVQRELTAAGVQIFWFDDLPETHPQFAAIQMAAIQGMYPARYDDLHASPDSPITRDEAARALAAKFNLPGEPQRSVVEKNWMAVDHRNWFHGDLPLYWTDIRIKDFGPATPTRTGPVTRGAFFQQLMR